MSYMSKRFIALGAYVLATFLLMVFLPFFTVGFFAVVGAALGSRWVVDRVEEVFPDE